jgi:hypothetical protein
VTLRELLHPDPSWLDDPSLRRIASIVVVTVAGLAAYGFTLGWWRSPVMAGYVAMKMPLLIACTLGCNTLFNGLFGLLMGSGLGIRQSFLALLMANAVSALILGSLAPVAFLLAWNAPSPDSPGADTAHSAYLVTHTFLIGFAGVMANTRLYQLLVARSPNRKTATATLLAWLAGNGFVGTQFSWILRPFFGSPNLDVAFLRPDAMHGNFYQAVWRALVRLTGHETAAAGCIAACVALLAIAVIATTRKTIHSVDPHHE